MDVDPHREGIRIVEYRHSDVGLLAKIANALGIAWYCVGDNDAEGRRTRTKLKDHLRSAEEEDRMAFPYENIEIHLLGNGYEHVYETFMPEQNRARVESKPGEPDYWREYAGYLPTRSKTRAAAAVAIEMGKERGAGGVSAEIRAVLDKVVSLARGA